jgi:hypothetical protein
VAVVGATLQEDPELYKKHFSTYVEEGLGGDDLEELYEKVGLVTATVTGGGTGMRSLGREGGRHTAGRPRGWGGLRRGRRRGMMMMMGRRRRFVTRADAEAVADASDDM